MWAAEIINHYLTKTKTKNYLEIGLWNGGTFKQINAELKDSVDPDISKGANFAMGSDEFFEQYAPNLWYKYDVIFIDGLHHTEQVDRDIQNSLKYLNEGGVIVLHDCNPQSEMRQRVPADFDIWALGWNGDVWKSIYKFRKNNSHLEFNTFVINTDEGIGIIIPNQIGKPLSIKEPTELDFNFLNENRVEVLNLVQLDDYKKKEFNQIKKPKIHFITYAEGVHRNYGTSFQAVQKLLNESIVQNTSYEVVLHSHNLDSIKKQPWFYKIKDYPNLFNGEWWKRDGYCFAYKVFLTKQILNIADDGDIVYYADSSAYFRTPFKYNLDRFFRYVEHNGHVCGAISTECQHNSFLCCDNTIVWNEVYENVKLDFDYILNKNHIAASWFAFKKNDENIKFVDEWAHWFTYEHNNTPLVRFHHTLDQSLFNMLVYKYGFKTFFPKDKLHEEVKNHNLVHEILNNEQIDDVKNFDKWFYNPHYL